MKQIPNLFTLLNLIFGCMAIVLLLQNGITIVETDPSPENPIGQRLELLPEAVYMAPLFIALAAVVDFLDGFVARALKASSEMGKQLDSLADVVSFGVAPSMIIYQFLRLSFAKTDNGLETAVIWLVPAFILAGAAAYRLAKFNLDTRQTHCFRGTPVPSVGMAVAAFPLIYWTSNNATTLNLLTNQWFWYGVVALLSWLMVSDIPIMSNKPKSLTVQGLLPQISVAATCIISAIFLGWWAAPVTFVAFVLFSIVFKNRIQ
ncbi:MAG TPA: CDP-alcohol phosphatidyltransferase family protein [Phnomibacter sp.]|nr:CDP-alcohol phosphatidyltransferase family protein [Phnomibacter sp.]